MSLWFKVVAVAVLATLLAMPALALSSCLGTGSHNGQHACAPDCPMMTKTGSTSDFEAQAQPDPGSTCCKISSGKTEPISPSRVPTTNSIVASPTARTIGSASIAAMQAHISDTESPPLAAPSQPVLCTFHI